jgi:glutamine transport system substrate-binding protein
LVVFIFAIVGCGGCGKSGSDAPAAADSMRKNKEVRIITFAVNAPFEYGSGTTVQGFDVDLGTEIGKAIGYPVKWVKASSIEKMFEKMKDGSAQIAISAIDTDAVKSPEFAFSKPYYETGDTIAHQRSLFDIKGLSSLSGKKIGVAIGRPGDRFMATQKIATGVAITKYQTLDDALGALNRAEVDAVIGDEPFIVYSSATSFLSTTTLLDANKKTALINKYQYAVVVLKDEQELLAKINETIDRMKSSGDLEKLDTTWLTKVREDSTKRGTGDKAAEDRKKGPKTISVNIAKLSGTLNMERLDGYQLVLVGPGGQFQSTPILTEGNKGHCKFTQPVPPGDYKLNISILKMTANVPVPEFEKTSLTMDMNISSTITILFK